NGAVLMVNGGSFHLEGVTVQNGGADGYSYFTHSGVMKGSDGNLTILNSVITHNDGGGIGCWASCNLIIQDTDVSGNSQSGRIGGAIYLASGTLTVERSTVHDNPNEGIFVLDPVVSGTKAYISDSTIANNSGSGIDMQSGDLYVSNSTIVNN